LPQPRPEKIKPGNAALSGTEQASLDLFRDTGSVEQVAEARGLKLATVYGHLTKAVGLGLVSADEVTGLSRTQLARIEETLDSVRLRGAARLAAVAEALDGEFGFEILRCVQAGLLRTRAQQS
jgi:ATP-dependent DNA helicase RecQ